jgi:Fe-S cluster assembly protein SufD
MRVPVRLGAAENTLIAQLQGAGAGPEAERLSVAGLPTRRVEAYHYTDLKLLLRAVPPLAVEYGALETTSFDIAGAFRLQIVNGRPLGHASAPAGVVVGKAAGAALTERDDVLVRLNSAFSSG